MAKQKQRGAIRRVLQNKTPERSGPSQFQSNIALNHRYRFTASSTVSNVTVSVSTLLGAVGVVATSATTGASIMESVKVNRIEVWSPPPSQGSAATCSILYPITNQAPSIEVSDTSISVSYPAHVVSVPPARSLCSFWNNANESSDLFTLSCPSGSIVDVWVSLILGDGNTNFVTATLVGANTGTVYYTCLDSLTNSSGKLKPVSLSIL